MSSTIARDVILTLQRNLHRLDFPDVAPAALATINAMREMSERLATLLQPVSQAKRLEGRALWESLAQAIIAIARKKRGVRLTPKDLKDLVENFCPEPDLAFWLTQYPPAIVGLLANVPELRKLIEARGVMFWTNWQDEEWRIVDSRWLVAHADIRRWVLTEWAGGRRCRFCGCQENPRVPALESVNPTRRNGVQMIGDTVVMQTGGVLTHEPCRKHWLSWTAIAAQYSSHEEAAAADKAAGRESRWEKFEVVSARLEAPAE
jgi:hypothetical protein